MRNLILRPLSIGIVLLIAGLAPMNTASAQTNTFNNASGNNWNTIANWSQGHVPLSTEDVVIPDNEAVTVNTAAVCATLTMQSGTNDITVTIASGQSLAVSGAVTMNNGTGGNDDRTLAVGSGTFSCGSLTMGNPVMANLLSLTISTGTVTVNGNINMTGSAARNNITFSGAGTLFINNNGTITGGSLVPLTGTVNYSGAAQTVGTYTYNNLTLSGSGIKTLTGVSAINANLTLGGTASATAATGMTIGGSVILGNGTSFNANTFSHTVNGNWTNNGSIFSSAGTITLSGTTQAINGTASTVFDNLIIDAGSVTTMSVDNTVSSLTFNVSGTASSLTQNGSSSLTVNGAVTINQPSSNTVSTSWNINAGDATVSGLISFAGTGSTTTSRVQEIVITTGTLNANGGISFANVNNTGRRIVMSGGAAVLNLGGALTTSGQQTLTSSTTSSFNYNDAVNAQTVNFFSSGSYSNLKINNTTTGGATLSAAVTGTNVTQNLSVQSGKLSNAGLAMALASGKSFSVSNGAGFDLSGTSAMVTVSGGGTKTFGTTSTVSYSGAAQSVTTEAYGNLVLSGTGNKTFAGATTIAGNLSIGGSTIALLPNSTTSTAATLTLGGIGEPSGSWGGTTSPATNKNGTRFGTTTTGIVNITTTSCATGTWLGNTSTDWFTASNWCGNIIPTSSTNVLIQAAAPFQPVINAAAVCNNITIGSGAALTISGSNTLAVGGNWANNGTLTANTSTVTFNGSSAQLLGGTSVTAFNNLTINETSPAITVTNDSLPDGTGTVFSVAGNLIVTQGNLILKANTADYVVTGNLSVAANGTLSHNISWDIYGFKLAVGGNVAIDGSYNYSAVSRAHVSMTGSGKFVHSGTSSFSILTLATAGAINADGPLTVDNNFWAMIGVTGGSFSTNGQTVVANGAFLNSGGTVNINGGSLTVTGGVMVGFNNIAGNINYTSGIFTTDGITIGDGGTTATGIGTFTQSAGTNLVVNGAVTINQQQGVTATNTWNINNGTATVSGLITFAGSSAAAGRIGKINITTGTLNANAGITFVASLAANKVIDMSGGAGTLKLKGALTVPAASSTLTSGATSIFDYTDAAAQTINFFSAGAYNNLYINNTNTSTGASLSAAITASNVTGNISVGSVNNGSLFSTANNAITLAASRSLTVAVNSTMNAGTTVNSFGTSGGVTINGTFKTANAIGFSGSATAAINSTNTPVITLGSTSTVEYNAAGNQAVTTRTYNNLTLSGSGNKTFAANTTINNNLSISGTAVALLANGTTSAALTLTLAAVNQATGSWGGSTSTATNKSALWFGSTTTGILNVNISCTGGTWLGTFSTDWNDAGNWCAGIPTATTDVIIPSAAANQPVIGASNGLCRNVTINSGASLTITGVATLTASGNWINNGGTFNAGTGTVIFNSTTAAQSIGGTTVSQSFNNITINKNGQALTIVTPVTSVTVAGILNAGAGTTVNAGTANIVAGTFTTNATATVDMGTRTLSVTTANNSGLLKTANTSASPITTGLTWGGTVEYYGATQNIVTGTYSGLTVNQSSGASSLTGNISVGTLLTMTAGNVNCGANTLSVTNNAAAAIVRTSGQVIGNLQRAVATGTNTYAFPVGTVSGYTPASFTLSGMGTGGNLTVSSTDAVSANYPSSLSAVKKLARYWTVSNSGVAGFNTATSNATFTFLAGDLVGGATFSNLKAFKYNGGFTYPASQSASATTFSYNGLPSLVSEFGAGECGTVTVASITGNPGSLCINATAQLADATAGGVWSSDAPSIASVSVGGLITANSAGSTLIHYTVTDASGCTGEATPTNITVNANSTISLSSGVGTNAQTICISNAITNITYAIAGGGTGASITAGALPTGITGSYSAGVFSISGTATTAGSFSYTVTTAGPCTNNSLSGTITVNPAATITLTSGPGTNIQSVCNNSAMTNITFAVGGAGTSASITAGALPAGVTGSYSAGVFTISGTATGTGVYNYTITATGGGCAQNTASGTITVNAHPTASFTKTMASSCGGGNDGTITVTAAGGQSPYSYNWTSTPSGFTAGTAAITGLSPKDYTIVVTDANACSATIPDITIWQALAPVITYTGGQPSSCANNGFLTLYGSYGVPPYTFSVDGINYQSGSTFTNLAAGTHTLYVKDIRGCISTKPNVTLTGGAGMVVTSYTRPASSCANDGTIELYRTGGVSPYTYSLNNVNYYSSNVFSNVAGGTYTGWVKDASGCKTSLTGIVVAKAAAVTVTSVKTNTSACATNGSIVLHAAGGVPGYTYSLTGAAGPYQSSNVFNGLTAGTYTGWVKDSKGCKASQFSIVIATDPASSITVSATTGNASGCANNGSIHLFRTGGTAPFTYSIDNITYQSSAVFINLAGGTYTGWVKDARGCTGSVTNIAVSQPSALTLAESHTSASLCVNDGTIQLRPGAGVAPYTCSLDDITYQPGCAFSGLAAGSYTGWVKDSRGCKTSVSVTIGSNPIVVTAYAAEAGSCAVNNGSIQLFRTGGVNPYTYSLDGITYQSSNTFPGLAPGTYTGYVKDVQGCVGTLSNIVVGPTCLPIIAGPVTGKMSNISNISVNTGFKLEAYPNPSTTGFTLLLSASGKEKISVNVTDIMGRAVYHAENSNKSQFIFGNDFKPGIYIVQVIQGDQKQNIRLIKE